MSSRQKKIVPVRNSPQETFSVFISFYMMILFRYYKSHKNMILFFRCMSVSLTVHFHIFYINFYFINVQINFLRIRLFSENRGFLSSNVITAAFVLYCECVCLHFVKHKSKYVFFYTGYVPFSQDANKLSVVK